MTSKQHRLAWWSYVGILAALAALSVVTLWLVWPYNSVRFPAGSTGTVVPASIAPGGEVTVTWPEFCNDGVATTVTRFADVLVEGNPVASFELPSVSFASPPEPTCLAPNAQSVVLPNYVVGPDGPTTFRLRNEIAYRPNPVRVVVVEALSKSFTIR